MDGCSQDRHRATRRPLPRTYGGREWLALPEFGIACIQARVDLTARDSQLQVDDPAPDDLDGRYGIRFRIRPLLDDDLTIVEAAAPLAVGWHRESRLESPQSIRTLVTLGNDTWPLDLSLVPHDLDGFRIRLGRDAFDGPFPFTRVRVEPDAAFLAGPPAIVGPGHRPLDERRDPIAGPQTDPKDAPCP